MGGDGRATPIIRPVAPTDLPAVRELISLLDDLQRDWRVFPPRDGIQEEVLARYEAQVQAGEAVHLVAEDAGGRVVGTAFAHEHVVSRFSDERSMEVSSVVVHPDRRGREIGRALLRAIAEEARRRGIGHLDLNTFVQNESAMRFWEQLGFVPRFVQLVATPDDVIRVTEVTVSPPAPRE